MNGICSRPFYDHGATLDLAGRMWFQKHILTLTCKYQYGQSYVYGPTLYGKTISNSY